MERRRCFRVVGQALLTMGLIVLTARSGWSTDVASPVNVQDVADPIVVLDQLGDGGAIDDHKWEIRGNSLAFEVSDASFVTRPLAIEAGAPTNSQYVTSVGDVGFGTAFPHRIGSVNSTGRHFNLRTDAAGTAGVAKFIVQGQGGGLFHLVHLGAPTNQKVFRMQAANGLIAFNVVRDDLAANVVTGALVIKMSNGNVGLKVLNPTHPLHLASGAHCTSGGAWTNASSRELKEDIQPITSEEAQATVQALQPVGYRYKNEQDERYVGFIAEDVPELVATRDRKGLGPMDVVAVLTKVVQDQQTEMRSYQAQLKQQQMLLDKLTQRLGEIERSGAVTPK